MIIGEKDNKNQILGFIPAIQTNMKEWQIVTVKIPNESNISQEEIIQNFMKIYGDCEGIIFGVNDYKIVMIIRLGQIENYALLKNDIETKMPKHDARVIARQMNKTGLKQVQMDFSDRREDEDKSFYKGRAARTENVFLVVEDDEFIRKTIKKPLEELGKVNEVSDGSEVIKQYETCNPDVVLIDIHLPNGNGIQLVEDIMGVDPDAFIVVMSADSVRDNVVNALAAGAVGFMAKPVKKEKLLEYLNQCITFRTELSD